MKQVLQTTWRQTSELSQPFSTGHEKRRSVCVPLQSKTWSMGRSAVQYWTRNCNWWVRLEQKLFRHSPAFLSTFGLEMNGNLGERCQCASQMWVMAFCAEQDSPLKKTSKHPFSSQVAVFIVRKWLQQNFQNWFQKGNLVRCSCQTRRQEATSLESTRKHKFSFLQVKQFHSLVSREELNSHHSEVWLSRTVYPQAVSFQGVMKLVSFQVTITTPAVE